LLLFGGFIITGCDWPIGHQSEQKPSQEPVKPQISTQPKPDSAQNPAPPVPLADPSVQDKAKRRPPPPPKFPAKRVHVIRRGDTVEAILRGFGITNHRLLLNIRDELAEFVDLRKIKPKHRMTAYFDANARLKWLRYFKNPLNEWQLDICWEDQKCYDYLDVPKSRKSKTKAKTSLKWSIETKKIDVEGRIVKHPTRLRISSKTPTFYNALKQQAHDPGIASRLLSLFGTKAELNRVYGGEAIDLLIEKVTHESNYVGYRNILFARFQGRAKPAQILVHYSQSRHDNTSGAYFHTDGSRSLKEQLFASPLHPFRPGKRDFGVHLHPILKIRRMHWGVDFHSHCGQKLHAIDDGIVITRVRRSAPGKMISIRHPNGWVSRYMHLSNYAVRRYQKVKRGQLVGYVGTTGLSTGCHLHFELLRHGRHLDPLKVFKLRRHQQLDCKDMRNFWKIQLDACHRLKLPISQCQLQLPQRCYRQQQHTFWHLARSTYRSLPTSAKPKRPGIFLASAHHIKPQSAPILPSFHTPRDKHHTKRKTRRKTASLRNKRKIKRKTAPSRNKRKTRRKTAPSRNKRKIRRKTAPSRKKRKTAPSRNKRKYRNKRYSRDRYKYIGN
jgi:murein DD-endopeptidase MepM/ murein hydrolase activator NlpD